MVLIVCKLSVYGDEYIDMLFCGSQALIGQHTFKLLPAAYQYKLIQLLPECDRVQVHDTQLRFIALLFHSTDWLLLTSD